MTRREAIESLEYLISGECTDTQMDYVDEIQMAITDMKICDANNAGWISVKDRLPEGRTNPHTLDFEPVLCATVFGDMRVYKYGQRLGLTEAHFYHGDSWMDDYVTHWMPLSEPPKENEDD